MFVIIPINLSNRFVMIIEYSIDIVSDIHGMYCVISCYYTHNFIRLQEDIKENDYHVFTNSCLGFHIFPGH